MLCEGCHSLNTRNSTTGPFGDHPLALKVCNDCGLEWLPNHDIETFNRLLTYFQDKLGEAYTPAHSLLKRIEHVDPIQQSIVGSLYRSMRNAAELARALNDLRSKL